MCRRVRLIFLCLAGDDRWKLTDAMQGSPTRVRPMTTTRASLSKRGRDCYPWTGMSQLAPRRGRHVLIHSRAFLRNPVKYPYPEEFRPERWLEPGWPTFQEPLSQFPTIKGMSSFGWGQRQCLGMAVTQDELLVACGSLAWCFNLKEKVDPATHQRIPVPTDKSNSLLIIKPDPFQMSFEPRSTGHRQEALKVWEEAEAADRKARVEFLETASRGWSGTDVNKKEPCSAVPERLRKECGEKVGSWAKMKQARWVKVCRQ